jgi:hypothetical protein
MVDLKEVDTDDEDDKDYTGDMGDVKITEPRYGQFIEIPEVGILFLVPSSAQKKPICVPLSDFPFPFVKAIVEKFNKDFITRPN